MDAKSVILVDICGTIFKSNTTFDFLDYLFSKKRSYIIFSKIRKIYLWKLLNHALFISFRIDLTRIIAISFLKGISRSCLLAKSELFYNDILFHLINKEVFFEIQELKSLHTSKLVLVSATIDIVGEIIGKKLSIDKIYTTQLKYDKDGICMGQIKNDLLGRKEAFLKQNGLFPPYLMTITDNLDDIDLIRSSHYNYIVIRNNENKWYSLLGNTLKNNDKYKKFYT